MTNKRIYLERNKDGNLEGMFYGNVTEFVEKLKPVKKSSKKNTDVVVTTDDINIEEK
jgi:hypothetical protein